MNFELGIMDQAAARPPAHHRAGVTLVFVVLVVTAILAVAVGIFIAIFGELRLAQELTDSFIALAAADEGVERLLYEDRIADSVPGCGGSGNCSYGPVTFPALPSGACYILRLNRVARTTTIVATGEYPCGAVTPVRRSLEVTYQK